MDGENVSHVNRNKKIQLKNHTCSANKLHPWKKKYTGLWTRHGINSYKYGLWKVTYLKIIKYKL